MRNENNFPIFYLTKFKLDLHDFGVKNSSLHQLELCGEYGAHGGTEATRFRRTMSECLMSEWVRVFGV